MLRHGRAHYYKAFLVREKYNSARRAWRPGSGYSLLRAIIPLLPFGLRHSLWALWALPRKRPPYPCWIRLSAALSAGRGRFLWKLAQQASQQVILISGGRRFKRFHYLRFCRWNGFQRLFFVSGLGEDSFRMGKAQAEDDRECKMKNAK